MQLLRTINRSFAVTVCVLLGALSSGEAQNTTAAAPASPKMEVEIVTITDFAALPYAIKPKHGPFILVLLNRSRFSPADLVLDSPNVASAQLTTLTSSMSLSSFRNLRRLDAIISVPPGVYQLKQKTTGDVRLTITIE